MAHLDFKPFYAAAWNIQSVKDKLSDKIMKKLVVKFRMRMESPLPDVTVSLLFGSDVTGLQSQTGQP